MRNFFSSIKTTIYIKGKNFKIIKFGIYKDFFLQIVMKIMQLLEKYLFYLYKFKHIHLIKDKYISLYQMEKKERRPLFFLYLNIY